MQLYPYQEQVACRAEELEHPALFLEMRLGKTVVALEILRRRRARRVLVLAPLSVLPVWEEHGREAGYGIANLRRGEDAPKRVGKLGAMYLANYEYLFRHASIGAEDWDAVLVDESTRIKNPRAKTTKLVINGFRSARTRMILSGCPAPESILEYVPQFLFLHGQFMDYRNFWQVRNVMFSRVGFDWVPRPGVRDLFQQYVGESAVVLSRRAANVGSGKTYLRRCVPLDPEQQKLQKAALKNWEVDGTYTSWRVVLATWLARVAGGFHPTHHHCVSEAKTLEVLDLLQGELHGQQVVVFFRFNGELGHVARTLRRHGFRVGTVLGETPPEDRERRRKLFAAGKLQVLCCQIKCVRMGLDFSAADTAIYYSNGYSLEDRLQSEDRLVHPGKAVPLLYVDLVTEDTVDEDVVSALRRKGLRSGAFLSQVFANFCRRLERD